MQEVILVDENDNKIGTCEKLEAHQKGLLHRAFSVFLFNKKGEMLIQKRAAHKYHSANKWSNTCCSHPAPNESILAAGHRRLKEELNITTDNINFSFTFLYRIGLENGLIEHELDHILIGQTEDPGHVNPEEVSQIKFIDISELIKDVEKNPEEYTFWFKAIIDKVLIKHQELIAS
ncbi:MAG: isopentenyl-diphosphate Delta-isomerase [Reichenbachiella sp.]